MTGAARDGGLDGRRRERGLRGRQDADLGEDARLGWLTPPDDAVALARTLAASAAMDKAELQAMGVRGRKFALATFAPAHIAASTLSVYSTLFEGPG